MSHPMLAQFKSDARGILSDLGQAVTYTPYGGDAVEISAVVDLAPDLAGMEPAGLSPEFGFAQAGWATLLVHADDLAATPEKDGDTVTLDSVTWTVRQVQRKLGGALWKLWCSASEAGWRR